MKRSGLVTAAIVLASMFVAFLAAREGVALWRAAIVGFCYAGVFEIQWAAIASPKSDLFAALLALPASAAWVSVAHELAVDGLGRNVMGPLPPWIGPASTIYMCVFFTAGYRGWRARR